MFEEVKLSGTHCLSRKNQEGLNPNYRGTITYDRASRKYYVLVLASQQRYVAVVSDLHRFAEHFKQHAESERGARTAAVDSVPRSFPSS